MKTYFVHQMFHKPDRCSRRTNTLAVETLEGRRLLAVVRPGDANLDLHFDSADFVQVFKAGKYETELPATWAEGDWDGGPGADGPTTGDGVFNARDLVAAFQSGRFNDGPYDAEAGEAVHERMPLSQDGEADVTVVYDSGNGAMRIDSSFPMSTFSLVSLSNNFSGIRPGALTGLFDVANESEIFLLHPVGVSTIQFGAITEPGLSEEALLADLVVDGSRAAGGGLGNVRLNVCDACVSADSSQEPDPAATVGIELTYDSVTGEIFVESPVPITAIEIVSQGARLIGDRPEILTGLFDVFLADKLFKLNPAGNSELYFGSIIPPGMSSTEIASDFTIEGTTTGGNAIGRVSYIVCADCVTETAVIDQGVEPEPRPLPFIPEGIIAGDTNEDYFFDESDFVLALKSGKFESGEPADRSEGDWNGDGEFSSSDFIAAFVHGFYGLGKYNPAIETEAQHERTSLRPGQNGDFVFTYDPATGDLKIEGTETISSLHIHSQNELLTPSFHLEGLFDVANRSSRFYMHPLGVEVSTIPGFLPRDLTYTEVFQDLTVDGSRLQGGGLGDVVLNCPDCIADPVPAVAGDITFDNRLDVLDIDMMAHEIRMGSTLDTFDINTDGTVNYDDILFVVYDLLDSSIGDANLDGTFDSQDLIEIFQAGTFEDPLSEAVGWAQGDWNFDGVFTSSDLVIAFQTDSFHAAALKNVSARGENIGLSSGSIAHQPRNQDRSNLVESVVPVARAADLTIPGGHTDLPRIVDDLFAAQDDSNDDWETMF